MLNFGSGHVAQENKTSNPTTTKKKIGQLKWMGSGKGEEKAGTHQLLS